MARITIDFETANSVAEALKYYLDQSAHNFGAGYADEDPDDREQLLYEHSLVANFYERVQGVIEREQVKRYGS